MYQIFDTREPEGDGGPMLGLDKQPHEFDSEFDARCFLSNVGIDPARVVIAPPAE